MTMEMKLHEREQIGIEQGRIEGRTEGIHAQAVESAKRFLKMGLSVEQISEGTGLSIEEINNLK